MEITRYIFQSPYSSQVQIGRPESSGSSEQKSTSNDSGVVKAANTVLSEAATFKAAQTQEVKATVESNAILDTYA